MHKPRNANPVYLTAGLIRGTSKTVLEAPLKRHLHNTHMATLYQPCVSKGLSSLQTQRARGRDYPHNAIHQKRKMHGEPTASPSLCTGFITLLSERTLKIHAIDTCVRICSNMFVQEDWNSDCYLKDLKKKKLKVKRKKDSRCSCSSPFSWSRTVWATV